MWYKHIYYILYIDRIIIVKYTTYSISIDNKDYLYMKYLYYNIYIMQYIIYDTIYVYQYNNVVYMYNRIVVILYVVVLYNDCVICGLHPLTH